MHVEGLLHNEEDPFGPGSDLVMSLMVALLLLVALGAGFYQISAQQKSVADSRDNSTRKSRATDPFRDEAFAGSGMWKLHKTKEEILRSEVVKLRQGLLRDEFQLLEVTGHSSPEGRQEYNMALAQLRAAEVANQLVLAGIPWECIRISAVGRGESSLLPDYWQVGARSPSVQAQKPRVEQNRDLRAMYSADRLGRERRVEIDKLIMRHGSGLCQTALRSQDAAVLQPEDVLELNRVMFRKLTKAREQRPIAAEDGPEPADNGP
jgi:hypothetical protein